MPNSRFHLRDNPGGFSLVEVTIAIGLFAFVIVAILSLFSVGLKLRSESALETKSSIIAQELFSSIRGSEGSGGLKNVVFRDGPGLLARNNQSVDFTRGESLVVGFPSSTTIPFGLWHSSRGQNPQALWESGDLEPWAKNNQIQTLAFVRVTSMPTPQNPRLYQISCDIRSPASLPLNQSKVVSYSTYFYE